MEIMKRASVILLSALMVSAVGATAFAAEVSKPATAPGSTNVDVANHQFAAYQILKGTVEGTGLKDVEWGDGVDVVNFIKALKASEVVGSYFAGVTEENSAKSAYEVACVLNDNADVFKSDTDSTYSEETREFAALAHQNKTGDGYSTDTEVAAGFYIVVDTTDVADENDAKNLSLLNMVTAGTFDINSKSDYPTLEKKVWEDTYAENDNSTTTGASYGKGFNDVADYNINDKVYYELFGTVATNVADYDTYYYEFNDTMSTGLTNNKDYTVYLLNKDSDGKYPTQSDKGVYTEGTYVKVITPDNVSADAHSFTLTFNDLKKTAGDALTSTSIIAVEFTATLNEDAVIGLDGNENKASLTYSNDVNYKSDGNNGGGDDNEDEDVPKGKTPEDKVVVFTYSVEVNKYDNNDSNKKLDAGFKLYNKAGKYLVLDANNRVLSWVDSENDATELRTGDDGLFTIFGLDNGTYYLKETTTPDGYVSLTGDIKLDITSTLVNTQTWTSEAKDVLTALNGTIGAKDTTTDVAKYVSANNNGVGSITTGAAANLSFNVANVKTFKLPNTGNAGTIALYVIGGMLVAGAAVMIIRKRVNG
jgi:fimbrial isopeptide formation D2 family protein/LPXTG-motif cell wall-anchored protein